MCLCRLIRLWSYDLWCTKLLKFTIIALFRCISIRFNLFLCNHIIFVFSTILLLFSVKKYANRIGRGVFSTISVRCLYCWLATSTRCSSSSPIYRCLPLVAYDRPTSLWLLQDRLLQAQTPVCLMAVRSHINGFLRWSPSYRSSLSSQLNFWLNRCRLCTFGI